MKKLVLVVVYLLVGAAGGYGQGWFELGTDNFALKANEPIRAICVDSSNNIYAAGSFNDSTIHGQHAKKYVAKWDAATHEWGELGTGMHKLNANWTINSICTDRFANIYAAGDFTNGVIYLTGYQYVAKWDVANGSWSELGSGSGALNAHGSINTICCDKNGNIYAGGTFRNTTGYEYVARWDPSTNAWSEVGFLEANSNINSICVDDSLNVYAAGDFYDVNGNVYVAKWDHTTNIWSELDTGFKAPTIVKDNINSIFCDSTNHIYAAVNIENLSRSGWYSMVVKWNGNNWSQLGDFSGNSSIYSICKGDSGFVYAAGAFTDTNGYKYVAKYQPSTNVWGELGTGTNAFNPHSHNFPDASILTLCVTKDGAVLAGGEFEDKDSLSGNGCFIAEYAPKPNWLGTVENNIGDLLVFPNPATHNVNFEYPYSSHIVLKIMDLSGKQVEEKDLYGSQATSFDVSQYPAGIYVYHIVNGKTVQTGKFTVE